MTTNIKSNEDEFKTDKNQSFSQSETEDDNDRSFTSSADSESSNPCPFNSEVASKLTTAFSKATGIGEQLATRLLRQHSWNIDLALKASYDVPEKSKITYKKAVTPNLNVNRSLETDADFRTFSLNVNLPDSEDEQINELIQEKAEKLIDILLGEKPSVIFLREIGTFALTLLITCLSTFYDDESIQIDPPNNVNYLSILTRKSDLKKLNVSMFENENHWRILQVEVIYNNLISINLLNGVVNDNSMFNFEIIDKDFSTNLLLCSISFDKSDQQPLEALSKEISMFESTSADDSDNDDDVKKQIDRIFYGSSKTNEYSINLTYSESTERFSGKNSIVRNLFKVKTLH